MFYGQCPQANCPVVTVSSSHRENLSVRGFKWFARYVMLNLCLFVLLTFLTTPTIIINTIDKFNVTKPIQYLNVRLTHADTHTSK